MATITLTNRQAHSLLSVLLRIDPASAQEQSNKPKYQFKGKVTYAFARNVRKLKTIVEDLEKTRQEIFKKHRKGDEETLAGAAAEAFTKEFTEVLDQANQVDIHQVDVNDLELDKNNINAEILAELLDVLVVGEVT